ncbi:LPS export ABC transporter permease LptG [Pseudothioclava nitratireducens]|jgi:lipopolysaccharide export system permease protein|uniref:LPS export ABC transporter permease LptG n=1 Tax=Pseudothioclava nitratireducens TaxID=1928646 RepID=UPI0023DBC21F|nr:LPS export ABC transporter permease LptG [Defluviimonas nitratireducens]MDF1621325.1 LPS export ABC transporter permease LptG [Defluviimonas nitratireducens]
MILSLYIARRFLRAFGIVAGSFFGILFLINLAEDARRFGDKGLSLGELAELSALKVPSAFYNILPLITVLAAVVLFVGLARSSELVVIRAAGRSALRMLMAPVTVALLLGVIAVAAGNPIVSATSNRYDLLANRYRATAGGETVSIGREGVWMRQSAGLTEEDTVQTQAVIHAVRANLDATQLFDVTFLMFEPGRGPIRRIAAAEAVLEPGAWLLRDAKEWNLAASTNPERDAASAREMRLPSDLTAQRIRDSFGEPADVPLWELPSFIAALENAGFSARRHMVWFQRELALPLLLAAMVLVAAGFTMRHIRAGGTGKLVLLAFAGGLGVFFLRNVAQVLGENGQIPVVLAAWAPPLIGLILPLALLLHLEDG